MLIRGISVVLGAVCVVLGVLLILSPLTALAVLLWLVAIAAVATGIDDLVSARGLLWPWITRATGLLWIALGAVAIAWPGLTVHGIAIVAGVGMVIGGLTRILTATSAATDERIAATLIGLTSIILGALALGWPDVTIFVIAVLLGARVVLFGFSHIVGGFWPRVSTRLSRAPGSPARPHDWLRIGASALALVVTVALLGVGLLFRAGAPSTNSFYTPSGNVPSHPGALLRSEAFTRDVPANARAWLILYTTTRSEGVSAVASAIVVAPLIGRVGPRPVIAWAHGTTGIAEGCAPSLAKDPFGSGAFFALDQVVAQGWVLVATDYTGLGTMGPTPYLVGQGEARSILDAVRAAKQLGGLDLADQTVVWGHSQGGNAALWTGIIAPTYAPDVHVVGDAALAPTSNLTGLVADFQNVTGGSIFAAYVLSAYSAIYPDVRFNSYVRPGAQVAAHKVAGRCLVEPEVFVSVGTALVIGKNLFSKDPLSGALGARLQQNTPTGHIDAPLLIAQGEADPLVLPAVQAAYVRRQCQAGQPIDYLTFPGRGHVGLVEADSSLIPQLLQWTQDRFEGRPAPSTCSG